MKWTANWGDNEALVEVCTKWSAFLCRSVPLQRITLPACWVSVNESSQGSGLYDCRQPARPQFLSAPVIPSQGRPPPWAGRWPTISVPAKARWQSSWRFVTVTFADCSRCALPRGTEFAEASALSLPDVFGGLTLPLPPMPVHMTLSNEHTG